MQALVTRLLPARLRDHRLTHRFFELARFGAVGATAFVVDIGIYNLLRSTLLADKPIGAKVISVAVAVVVAWIGNRYWTFRGSKQRQRLREFVLFGLMNAIGLLIAAACLFVSHYVLGFDSRLADNISGNGVGLVLGTLFRYVAYKHLVFTGGGAQEPASAPEPAAVAAPGSAAVPLVPAPVEPDPTPTPRRAVPAGARAVAVVALAVAAIAGGVAVAESSHAATPGLAPVVAPVVAQDGGPLLTPDPDVPQPSEPGSTPSAPGAPNRDEVDDATDTSGTGTPPLVIAGYGVLGLVALGLTSIALTTLWWMLHAWRSETALRRTGFVRSDVPPGRTFTLLVPARHEEAVLAHTLERLVEQDHPHVEIIAIVGHDDPGTEAVARSVADRFPDRVRVVVDDSVPKNKPKALNRALQTATGDVVGVFDAEDEVHPHLLTLVDERFVTTGADVVQGGVQLMNHDTTWWSLRNVLEYYFWFRSRLHFHAEQKFIPLGGNTVFISTDRLRGANGWDAECLAEDCEIGVRLSSEGAKVVVAYDPDVVTREETPGTLTSLFKQRTRWNQGFLQVLRKGEWRKLPTRGQRLFARYMLAMPFLQAFTGLLIPVSIFLILFVKVPTQVALLTFLPIAPTLVILSVEIAGLGEFGRAYGRKIRMRDYVRLVLGTFPYQVFLAIAAIRSVLREMRGDNSWEKTEHSGAHIESSLDVPAQPVASIELAASGPVAGDEPDAEDAAADDVDEIDGTDPVADPAAVEDHDERPDDHPDPDSDLTPETTTDGAAGDRPAVERGATTTAVPGTDATPTGEIWLGTPEHVERLAGVSGSGYRSSTSRSTDRLGTSGERHTSGDAVGTHDHRHTRTPVASAAADRAREVSR